MRPPLASMHSLRRFSKDPTVFFRYNKVLDGDFHSERNEGTTRYSRLRWGVSESYK